MRVLLLLAALALAACGEEKDAAPPPPAALTQDAIGHYDHMAVLDHDGPKGQIFVKGRDKPFWFSSVRDTVAFTLLPEEPKDIRAIYVQDIARAQNWRDPGPQSWMDARTAHYVIGSKRMGGMGQPEAVPFSAREAAIVARDYILGDGPPSAPQTAGTPKGHSGHSKGH